MTFGLCPPDISVISNQIKQKWFIIVIDEWTPKRRVYCCNKAIKQNIAFIMQCIYLGMGWVLINKNFARFEESAIARKTSSCSHLIRSLVCLLIYSNISNWPYRVCVYVYSTLDSFMSPHVCTVCICIFVTFKQLSVRLHSRLAFRCPFHFMPFAVLLVWFISHRWSL